MPRPDMMRRLPSALAVLEALLAAVALLLAARFGWLHGGQIEGTDVLLYMDVAQHPRAEIYILNRYTHVYLHMFFQWLAPSPLLAVRLFSAALAGSSVLLVYLCARSLMSGATPVNGVLAVGLFLSLPLTLHLLLAPQVDSTLMLMYLLFAGVFIWSSKSGHRNRGLLALLGLCLFFTLKTKETGLAVAIMLPGLGFTDGEVFSLRRFLTSAAYVGLGFLAGASTLMLLNGMVLRDPLFGLRPSEFAALGRIASGAFVLNPAGGGNWLAEAALAQASVPFILYIGGGLVGGHRARPAVRVLWLVPLALLGVLTLTLIKSTWGVVPRYFAPGLGLVCVLAGHVVEGRQVKPESLWRWGMWSLGVLGLVGGVTLWGLALRAEWPFPSFYESVVSPFTLASLLGALLASRGGSRESHLALLGCALVLSLYPARLNLLRTAQIPALERINTRFYAIEAFRQELSGEDLGRLFTTAGVAERLRVGDNTDELSMLVNVALDADSQPGEVAIGEAGRTLRLAMARGAYDHVLLTRDDWDLLRTGDEDVPGWDDAYQVFTEPTGAFFLLQHRE